MSNQNNILLSVVIPVYNEEQRIETNLRKLYSFFKNVEYDYEIVISDDGSTDNTTDIVTKFINGWSNLRVLKNLHKGKAPAIISGINNANGKYVLMTDIDLSVDITELPKLLGYVKDSDYDIAIASREGSGARRINEPFTRHIMGRVFNALVQIVLLPGIQDTQCGFKLFKTEVAQDIFKHTLLYSINDPEIKGGRVSAFDVEILFVAKKLGYTVRQVPIVWVYGDKSKVHNLKDSYYNAKDVFKVRLFSISKKYNFKNI